VRERHADLPVPDELALDLVEHRELLARWVRDDKAKRSRTSLLKEAGSGGIERAEVLCDRLLHAGWIRRAGPRLGAAREGRKAEQESWL
jgi:hypothetical protein